VSFFGGHPPISASVVCGEGSTKRPLWAKFESKMIGGETANSNETDVKEIDFLEPFDSEIAIS
jgi:hypothetical protein